MKLEFTREKGEEWDYQVTNFKCEFPFLRNTDPNKPFLYQIYWNIDGVTVHVTKAVQKEDFMQTFLNEKNGIVKMGIKVSFLMSYRVLCVFFFFTSLYVVALHM